MPYSRMFYRLAVLLCALASPPTAPAAASDIAITAGPGSFVFVDRKGDPAKRMTVYTYLPGGLDAAAARIVFVMHGVGKNARGYRDSWIEHADRHRFLVVAPLFDREQWGRGAYSYSSAVARDGTVHDAARWSFSAIEHLFDAITDATANPSTTYYIYGHSEGGQFVQRLVLLLPGARYARAVAANPGWYTMPAFDVGFPYGLGGAPVNRESLRKSLARDFVLLLGDRDTDSGHPQLRRTPEAMAQGAHRFERGENYFRMAQARAGELKSGFGWKLEVVPGAGHQNSRMSGPAAAILME
jgi:poly(3-hydroxybutyrate) depolymerase